MAGSKSNTIPLKVFVCMLVARCLSLDLSQISRRALLRTSLPTAASLVSSASWAEPQLANEFFDESPTTRQEAGRTFFPTITPPFRSRATYRYNLGRGAWAFEQLLAFANVTATIRMNVIQLQSGGLWVHSPVYPTGEALSLLSDLPGSVEHIVLPCNALEHKAPMASFCRAHSDASVWVSPGLYGPFGSCGQTMEEPKSLNYRIDGILGGTSQPPPWADEFDMATIYASLPENAGPVSEVAFCHKPTQTLVATDAVIFVPSTMPAIFGTYFADTSFSPYFWERSVLQAVFLPLRFQENAYPGFGALENRLVRAPILRAFTDARAPDETREWVETISRWKFDRILTSHFASPIRATPMDFKSAFGYLYDDLENLPPIACQDWDLLEGLNQVIKENKLGAPATFDYSKGCR